MKTLNIKIIILHYSEHIGSVWAETKTTTKSTEFTIYAKRKQQFSNTHSSP